MRLFRVKKSRLFAILITSLTFFALTGCSSDKIPQDFLFPASQAATDTASLFYMLFWVALAIFILVEGLLVFFVLRYQRTAQDEHPEQYHGNTRLEVTWTLIPAVILAVVFAFTIRTMAQVGPTNPPAQGIPITVIGHQWWWEVQYNNGKLSTATEIHVPLGQVVNVSLNSDNVIHSFWVPSLMGKTDVVPTHDNKTWLLGNTPGTFDGQCAEFCGAQHAHMLFRVIVQTPDDFKNWLAAQAAPPVEPAEGSLEAQGKAILTDKNNPCVTCHAIQGTNAIGITGPNLTHFAARACFIGCYLTNNTANVTRWLTDPETVKPGNVMAAFFAKKNFHLSPDQVTALTAYLESLK